MFYIRGDDVIAVSYSVEGETVRFGEERVLFQTLTLLGAVSEYSDWAISPDAERFLMLQPGVDTPSRPELRVVYGW